MLLFLRRLTVPHGVIMGHQDRDDGEGSTLFVFKILVSWFDDRMMEAHV